MRAASFSVKAVNRPESTGDAGGEKDRSQVFCRSIDDANHPQRLLHPGISTGVSRSSRSPKRLVHGAEATAPELLCFMQPALASRTISDVEAFASLVRASDFKSDGGCGDTSPAGSIPVRFRHPPEFARVRADLRRFPKHFRRQGPPGVHLHTSLEGSSPPLRDPSRSRRARTWPSRNARTIAWGVGLGFRRPRSSRLM